MRRILCVMLFLILSSISLKAQEGTPINFVGIVESIDGTTIVVNGLSVDVSGMGDDFLAQLAVDTTVTVSGTLLNGVVTAETVAVSADDEDDQGEDEDNPTDDTDDQDENDQGDDQDDPSEDEDEDENNPDWAVILVIEGPVQRIEGNEIEIYGITMVVDETDPQLLVIQVGDWLHVEGTYSNNVIIVINIVFIDVDVFVFEGQVWRDLGECGNAPPPWAPAVGWRRKCEGGSVNVNVNVNVNSSKNSKKQKKSKKKSS